MGSNYPHNTSPSINADGTRIAFTSYDDLTGGNADGSGEIFLWTSGSGLTQITSSTLDNNLLPSINADGTKIAFGSGSDLTGDNPDGNPEIFLWTQGSGFTQITNTRWQNDYITLPSINADGTRIAFVPRERYSSMDLFLWTQGSGITQITDSTLLDSSYPSINADGTRIAFGSRLDLTGGNPDGNMELFLWTQGSGFTQITNTTGRGGGGSPSINADGTRIAFTSHGDLTGGNPDGNMELFLWTQGSGFTQITNTTGRGDTHRPSINSDGSRIAFRSTYNLTGGNPDGNEEIFLAEISQTPPTDNVTITSGPSGTPNPVASGGVVTLGVAATDSQSHQLSYSWSTLCSGLPLNGSFSNANIQNPIWTAPTNTTGSAKTCTLTVTASDGLGHSDTKSFSQTVSASTTTLPTASWTTLPPTSLTVGQKFEVAWTTTGTPTHVNVHWNPTDPLAPGCCLGASNTTDSSTSSPTKSPATLTAPTKNADGMPITLPITVKYVVHVSNSAGSGNSEIVSVIVNPSPRGMTPTFSPPPGTVTKPVKVGIATATKGATIRYTTDGSDPTATSPRYRKRLTVSQTTVLKARAFKSGMADSDVAEGTYTFVTPQKIVLLLHGMNSNPETWNSFAQAYFEGACYTVYAGVVLATPRPNPKGTLCYRVKFGEYDSIGPDGLENAKYTDGLPWAGDFSTFEQLGNEVAEAVEGLRNGYPNATIVLVGHSRGGLAARAFLQGWGYEEERDSVAGLVTTGTPHLGTRLGRIYAYLQSHPRGTDEKTWNAVEFLAGTRNSCLLVAGTPVPMNVRRPTIDFLRDGSSEIDRLNNLSPFPTNVRYGQIAYRTVDLGILGRLSDAAYYSIFDRFFTNDICEQVSDAAVRYILDKDSPATYKGDGVVSRDSQRGAAPSHAKQVTYVAPDILHTEEPGKLADVLSMFKKLKFQDWLR